MGEAAVSVSHQRVDASPLFTPFRIGRMTLKNRFVMAPMGRSSARDGILSPAYAPYYARRAAGGTALIIGEATAIGHPTAMHMRTSSTIDGAGAEAWAKVADAVHAAGGAFMPQLWHAGLMRSPYPADDPKLEMVNHHLKSMSPSGLYMPGLLDPAVTPPDPVAVAEPMTAAEIDACIAAYAGAARTAMEIGCDGINIHGAHGYLIDEFLWARLNRRTDRWGGSIANRIRFAVEVVAACRAATAPDFPILLRLSQWKQQDYRARLAETPDELADIVVPLSEAGADLFDCSTRRFWEPEFPGSDLGLSGWIKRLTGKPAMMVGSLGIAKEILEKDAMAALRAVASGAGTGTARAATIDGLPHGLDDALRRFSRGDFDLMGVGRMLISNPDFANRVQSGDHDGLLRYQTEHLLRLE
ncbi:MAG TPA: 12-oxophytodienoate reductase [Sphingopyxis sp.]|nr:12-oxophytodienoate reductase [Sphingopyxis sp.]HMP44699.1 12-oxophytodienoate reductase [Sphingopyxis sp.]HMQ18674.1 12-oxophytodienoate reductase [Sphingopyxis sp.]